MPELGFPVPFSVPFTLGGETITPFVPDVPSETRGGVMAAEVYAALEPIAEPDAKSGYPLRALVRAIASMFAQAEEAIRALGDGLDSWERLWNPDEQPDWMLPFVGQAVGVAVDTGRTPAEQREQIKEEGGWKRGRIASAVAAIQATLTGTKAVKVVERYTGNAWLVLFTTKPEETPNPKLTEVAAFAQKPGGMIFLFSISSLPRIDEATRTINAAEGQIDTATIANVT
jgi:hypothetical protein